MRARRRAAALGSIAVLALRSITARAEPIAVRYEAPPSCPDAAAFVGQITARTSRFEQARPGDAARSFAVEVIEDGAEARGRLTIRERDGTTSSREVPKAACAEVVAALALIAAITIDPEARTDAPPPAPAAPPSAPARPAPAAPPRTSSPAPPATPRTTPSPARLRPGAGAHFAIASAVAPDIALGFEGFAELRLDRASVLSPSVRLSAIYAQSGATENSVGAARFRWIAGRLGVCPLRFPSPRAARAGVSPCAVIDAGALVAAGERALDARTETRAWFAPGLVGRAELVAFDLLFLEAEGGVTIPLPSYRFYFGPRTTIFEVPRAGAIAAVGAGLRFL
jgi:hypothetical protein